MREPDELVLLRVEHGMRGRMSHAGEGQGGVDPVTGRETGTPLSRAIFDRLRATPAPASHVFAFAPFSRVDVIAEGAPEPAVAAQYVSRRLLRRPRRAGRRSAASSSRADDAASAPPVAVHLAPVLAAPLRRPPDAIGRTILVNKVPATVVGVSAAGFDGAEQIGETADVSVPLAHHLLFQPDRPGARQAGATGG